MVQDKKGRETMFNDIPTYINNADEAAKIAAFNNESDEDCTYEVESRGAFFVVKMIDEDGEFVGYL